MLGRPSTYSADIGVAICTSIASGDPLTKICKRDDMPDVATVYRWLLAHPDFCEMYTRAREDQADTYADQIIDIADESKDNPNMASVQSAQLRVEARKWTAAKLKPRKYIDSKAITGPEGSPLPAAVFAIPMAADDMDSWSQKHTPPK